MTLLWKTKTILNMISLCLCGIMFFNLICIKSGIKFNDIKRGISYVFSRKVFVVFCGVCFLTVYCSTQYFCNGRLPQLRVKFNYEEASKGLNPNKTRFNASKLLSDELLGKAIEKGGFDITPEELAGCLEFSSSFDEQQINASSEILDIATEYRIVCKPDIFQYNIDAYGLFGLLADVYYEEFIGRFSENDSILNLNLDGLKNMDYMDADNYLELNAKKLHHFMSCYNGENPTYRLEKNGETFSSLAEKIGNFIDVELERFSSFVLENGLSKDSDDYITRMNHLNRLLQTDCEKNMAAYDVRLETIDMYDEQMASIVLVPTNDENLKYYMSRTKIGVDYFAEQADRYLQTATLQKEQMEHNDYAKSQIVSKGRNTAAYEKADTMLETLKEELESLAQQSRQLSDSYINQKRRGYLKIDNLRSEGRNRMNLKNGLINTVIFGFMLCGYLVSRYVKDESKSKKRNVL